MDIKSLSKIVDVFIKEDFINALTACTFERKLYKDERDPKAVSLVSKLTMGEVIYLKKRMKFR